MSDFEATVGAGQRLRRRRWRPIAGSFYLLVVLLAAAPALAISVGDLVWQDDDADGVKDVPESVLPNVTVRLFGPAAGVLCTGTPDMTTTTDGSGNYSFDVPAGDYCVELDESDPDLGSLTQSTTPSRQFFTLVATDNLDVDFGYRQPPQSLVDPCAPLVGYTPLTITFETDAMAQPLSAGDVFNGTQHYAPFGVNIEAVDLMGACTGPALIFDSANPTGGDLDLGSPNTTCGGLGAGAAGAQGDLYENCVGAKNILIAQENALPSAPDDCGAGATLRITFSYNTTIFDLESIDVDDVSPPDIQLYDAVAVGPAAIGSVLLGTGPAHDSSRLGENSAVRQTNLEAIGPGIVRRLDFVMPGSGSINEFAFCIEDSFLPVTLASFRASGGRGGTLFEWTTATEIRNAGFNLYAETEDGWHKVNHRMIPSQDGDSIAPQQYRYRASGLDASWFFIEDVDLAGKRELHGPFALGQTHGGDVPAEPIDWQAIRGEHRERARARRVARGAVDDRRPDRGPSRRFRPAPVRPGRRQQARSMQLRVDQSGIYRVTYEAIRDAGVDLAGVPMAALALLNRGEPVPMHVERTRGGRPGLRGLGRGRPSAAPFGPGGFIEFYGEALDTLYTKTNVYQLRVDPRRAVRLEADSQRRYLWGPPPAFYLESLTVERNRQYNLTAPSEDPWFDTRLLAYQAPVAATVDFEVDHLLSGDARLTVDLLGLSSWPQEPDHHVEVGLNGGHLAETRFDGRTVHELQVDLPSGSLRQGTNTLELNLPADTGASWDMVALDRFRVTYPRRFVARDDRLDFTSAGEGFRVEGLSSPAVVVWRIDGDRMTRLDGARPEPAGEGWAVSFAGIGQRARYLVSGLQALRVPVLEPLSGRAATVTWGAADFLIISHPDFIPGLEPLIAERERQGLRVKVVDVEDVYQRFGHGIFDPEAIRRYIAFAARALGTEQVLLVGGDSYDYHDYLGQGAISFLPSLYAATGQGVRFAPADPLYADVDGDGVQDLALGRFPVRSAAELEALVQKTLDYSRRGYRFTGVFAADAADSRLGESFADVSDELIAGLSEGWAIDRAYIDDLGLDGAHDLLVDAVNRGSGLTSFFGHSGPTLWSFQGLFDADDAAALINHRAPTVVTQWGCWNTYYVTPSFNTMAHKLLLTGDQGAAAVLGASTLTRASSDRALGALLMPKVSRQGVSIGQALRDAKQELAQSSPQMIDVLIGWTLLGDPTMELER